jgi:hypothetical protein
MTFKERLSSLGFSTYQDYLESDHWQNFRERYKKAGRPMRCAVCKGGPIQLHHHDYSRLGHETFADVDSLCGDHHQAVHAWLKERKFSVQKTAKAINALESQWRNSSVVQFQRLAKIPQATRNPKQKKNKPLAEPASKETIAKVNAVAEQVLRGPHTESMAAKVKRYLHKLNSLNEQSTIDNLNRLRKNLASGLNMRAFGDRFKQSAPKSRTRLRSDRGNWENVEDSMRMIAAGFRPRK